MDKLLGAQTAMNNRGIHAPMSLMISLYPRPQPTCLRCPTRACPAPRRRVSRDASLERGGDANQRGKAKVAASGP